MSDEKPTTISELAALIEEAVMFGKALQVEDLGDGHWLFNLAGIKAVVRAKELEKLATEAQARINETIAKQFKLELEDLKSTNYTNVTDKEANNE